MLTRETRRQLYCEFITLAFIGLSLPLNEVGAGEGSRSLRQGAGGSREDMLGT